MAKEGLRFARLVLVLSSFGPLFVLWAIRGVDVVPDYIWVPICIIFAVAPSLFLWYLIVVGKNNNNKRDIKVASAQNQREQILAYLFAMLLPLYDINLGGWRQLVSVIVAFAFVVAIFWYLRLHYMNIFFALVGYHIFTVETPESPPIGRRGSTATATYVVLTRRRRLDPDTLVSGIRLGGNVLMDTQNDAGTGLRR